MEEQFTYSNYVTTKEVPSQIDPDVTHTVETGFRCPRCKDACTSLQHGEAITCEACDLNMCLYGNCLTCTTTSMDSLVNAKRGPSATPLTILKRVFRALA